MKKEDKFDKLFISRNKKFILQCVDIKGSTFIGKIVKNLETPSKYLGSEIEYHISNVIYCKNQFFKGLYYKKIVTGEIVRCVNDSDAFETTFKYEPLNNKFTSFDLKQFYEFYNYEIIKPLVEKYYLFQDSSFVVKSTGEEDLTSFKGVVIGQYNKSIENTDLTQVKTYLKSHFKEVEEIFVEKFLQKYNSNKSISLKKTEKTSYNQTISKENLKELYKHQVLEHVDNKKIKDILLDIARKEPFADFYTVDNNIVNELFNLSKGNFIYSLLQDYFQKTKDVFIGPNTNIASFLNIRTDGNFKNKSFLLCNKYDWSIEKDNNGSICLIPKEK